MRDAWELLRDHESHELVKRDYYERHGRTPNAVHAREIAAPFTHARSYFAAAKAADLTVKPLLLYYGVVSLSRGLTLTLSRNRREATLANSHGLSTNGWRAELSGDNPDVARLQVEINASGSFSELGQATEHRSLLRSNSTVINFLWAAHSNLVGREVGLGDLLARIPALQETNIRWRNISLCALFEKDSQSSSDNCVVLHIPKHEKPYITREFCVAVFAGTGFSYMNETPTYFEFVGPKDADQLLSLTDGAGALDIGDLWVAAKYPNDISLSQLETLFITSYILGMLVRYFPMQWTGLIRGQIGDAALPTISTTVEMIEKEFPCLVRDFLSREAKALIPLSTP